LNPSLEEKRRLRAAIWDRDKGRCRYCGKACHWNSVPYDSFDDDFGIIEHVIPMSKGGTWNIENLVLACNYCNAKKALLNGERITLKFEFSIEQIERFMRIAGIQV
jgi:5-methylcytosine-specific restriction endonuclease McrA